MPSSDLRLSTTLLTIPRFGQHYFELGRVPHTSEGLFNVDHFPGRGFHETAAPRSCPLPTSFTAHNSCILQVALVASYNHDRRYTPSLFSLASHSSAFLAKQPIVLFDSVLSFYADHVEKPL